MRKKKIESIGINNISRDFEQGRQFVENILKADKASKTASSEALLVFESIYHNIEEQTKEDDPVLKICREKHWGSTSIVIEYEGEMYIPADFNGQDLSLEDMILKAYNEKLDYSYVNGINSIQITIKHSCGRTLIPCVLGFLLAVIVYILLRCFFSEEENHYILSGVIFPFEKWSANLLLMVGAPVTFISYLKNLTDTYIILGRRSSVRKIRQSIIVSSVSAILMALVISWIVMWLVPNMSIDHRSPLSVSESFQEALATLIPSDIFTPFMVTSPFPLLILATVVASALCTVGKYFDRLKRAIDTCYVLFSRILTIIMYGLPFFVFLAFLDVMLSMGMGALSFYGKVLTTVLVSFLLLGIFYLIRLARKKIPVRSFIREIGPLLLENYRIGSAIDAEAYNIRYCAKTWKMDRKMLEINIPVLSEINLDGNCFFLTLLPIIMMFSGNSEVHITDMLLIGVLVFYLSLGAPNQPGSVLIGMLIILNFMRADVLISAAFIYEAFFGGLLNIVNVIGDIITVYELDMDDRIISNGQSK